jgi:hypothetical protein
MFATARCTLPRCRAAAAALSRCRTVTLLLLPLYRCRVAAAAATLLLLPPPPFAPAQPPTTAPDKLTSARLSPRPFSLLQTSAAPAHFLPLLVHTHPHTINHNL